MKNNRKFLMIILTAAIVIVSACGQSSAEPDDQSPNRDSAQETNDNATDEDTANESEDPIENASEEADTQSDAEEETANQSAENEEGSSKSNSSNNEVTESKKDEYVQKLADTKEITEELEASDSSTYALKEVENERWDIWDELLNEIYGVLEEQLSSGEMDQLREEQREWIELRDESALEASLEYKGGTQEHLEYVSVLANMTEERCYELVEDYMK
ncbi:lysozyme inhibitor LprI family protein [Virgibacillus oceani]